MLRRLPGASYRSEAEGETMDLLSVRDLLST